MSRDPEAKMNFFEHLAELRSRLLRAVLALVLGFSVAYVFSKTLFRWLRIPFDQAYVSVYGHVPQLQNISLLEGFMTYLRVALLGGFFLASPYILYQMWQFIVPALKDQERRYLWPAVILGTLCFVGGAVFGYGVVFPQSFVFLLRITQGELIAANITMADYFKFASVLLLGFGVAFEFPLVLLLLVRLGLVSPTGLIKAWRMVVIVILVVSAILTPADVASMLLMAAPLMVLYVLTWLLSYTIAPRASVRPKA